MTLLGVILLGVVFALTLAYVSLRKQHTFWPNRGFPFKPNPSLISGHMQGNGRTHHAALLTHEIYRYGKDRGEKFIGYSFFFIPVVMVIDWELIKTVLVKDFTVFHDRGIYSNPRVDPLSGNLFALEGHEWRTLRQKLTPTFTSGKMKQMFGAMMDVAEELRRYVMDRTSNGPMEMKDVLMRFTTDVIGTCAFGIECNTLQNPDSDFLKYGSRIFRQKLSTMVKTTFAMMYKNMATRLGVKMTEDDVEAFFLNLVRDTVEHRESNGVQRNDFLDLLLQIKNKGSLSDPTDGHVGNEEDGMTLNELAAQVFLFFVAGFETSSTVMNFCLYELAKNPEIQDRLREEIAKAIEHRDEELTYDCVMHIEYLDRVVNETLRKYPPLESMIRVTSQDYTIPGTSHVIPRNTLTQVPVYALHHDPDHYPDPDRFDPERFSEEECKKRPPYTFLPFGEGPRICIGVRFGMMQVKVGLITLLRNFRFTRTSLTPDRFVFDPKSFILSPSGGNYLRVDAV